MKLIIRCYRGNVGIYKIYSLIFRGGAKGREREGSRWEDEKAWENGNQEDKRRQSHFNLLAGCYVCLSELCAQSL